MSLLAGYVAYKSLQLERAHRWLEPLVEDAAYRRRRPAARYYLGRSLYAMGRFRDGVAHLDAFRRDAPALAREAIATRVARPGERPEP